VLLDKALGLSSNAALQRVRRMLGAEKAGHVGSLDPLATGMLPICLGEATKIAGDMIAGRKLYRFTVNLGVRTATGDAEGAVVETSAVPSFDRARLEAVLLGFHGRQSQIPPMYSALKHQGRPLYQLARAGVDVERAPREIDIYELRALTSRTSNTVGSQPSSLAESWSEPCIELEVLCS
jgi:tRNA pseudouridine55 synthase